MTYLVHTKITWEQKVIPSWKEFFYPSLVKKILKSEAYFEDLFEFKITPVNEISECEKFFLIYDKEIASRRNYLFKKNEQKENLAKKIDTGRKYFQSSLYKKESQGYVGGIIFSIIDDRFSFAFRAFDKNVRSEYRSVTTIDFWVEKKMYENAVSQNITRIFHGYDNYPNKGRTGLVLFKLKLGGRPKISNTEHDILEITENIIKEYNAPTFFWDNPDENNFFKVSHLFYKEGEIDESVLAELVKVTAWAGIELNLHKL